MFRAPPEFAPPAHLKFSRPIRHRMMRLRSPGLTPPARSCWVKQTATNSPWAARTRILHTVQYGIPCPLTGSLVAPAEARPPLWRQAWLWRAWGPIPAVPFVSPAHSVGYRPLCQHTDAYPDMALLPLSPPPNPSAPF